LFYKTYFIYIFLISSFGISKNIYPRDNLIN
jgi:hypothetical protein